MNIIDFDTYWTGNPSFPNDPNSSMSLHDRDFAIRRQAALCEVLNRLEGAINQLDARLDPALLHPEPPAEEFGRI